ncbi:3D-(3,5/4)-trihydroxycyclohexane-1,2-dione acylhydrolase (decyclizing) [Candidatus Epulonipiscium viviparus]|uniref:3D-(3,5/4)-trihydroxycyclohexane-1,2-dione acylhydrolase (decyclizing) n=1 Tax=Candidatus Epulonipiscium viviparus TaxID=420336 RepID=UPI00016C05D6|nr:3D-(3,5/4)-trihydroxycyclohexane-1,2-dione acylhydrolase (decyclizing) [Candidatus Epulopiscium viviparus]
MATKKLTMAQALVEFLINQYIVVDGVESKFVHGVLAIFGHGNAVGLGQALEEYQDQIKCIAGKNEQEIAHVGVGYAKQSRRRAIFACTASMGPGSLNMVTAAGTASVNRIPILFLPSEGFSDRQPDPALQQMEHDQDATLTANDAFKAVSKYFDRIERPVQLMTAMLNAMRTLTDPAKTGAVTICIPQDVQGEPYDYPEEFLQKRCWYVDRAEPGKDVIKRAVAAIQAGKKPVIVSGGGTRYSDAGDELVAFANEFQIPITETQAGKGEVLSDVDLNLGASGICGTLSANLICKKADIILAVGTKLNDFVTNSKAGYSKDAQIVSINTNRMDAFKLEAVSIVADAREGIKALGDALRKVGYKADWGTELSEAKQAWADIRQSLAKLEAKNGENLNQTRVLMELNPLLKHDNVVVSSGSLPSDLERIWEVNHKGGYHAEYGFSCMSYEISGALGVKMFDPSRDVYTFIGDGAFMMGHSDLYTSIQERTKINVLLFNNSGHQCIHNLQKWQGMDKMGFATEFRYREASGKLDGNLIDVKYAELARAYGANSWRVTTIAELHEAIALSRQSEVSTLIEIMVEPGTMTEGYEHYWRVGTAEVAKKDSVVKACKEMKAGLEYARWY